MADKIQLTLENMIPELDQFVKLGIFQKKDIKKIVKKRRFYEYQFERKDVSINDFFKAIKYEKVLDRRRISIKKQNNIKKVGYADFHFLRRIVYLFKKCLAKFKKDKNIWFEFFNFLIKHKCSNILNKEIGVCLANHPNNLDFWKIAAYNEYENNLNTFVARNLFQKCLRMNKDNIQAYLEYFIFEIKFVEKILERRKILSLNEEENKLKFLNDTNEIQVEEERKKKEEDENLNISDDVLNLKICEIIWKKAINAIINEDKVSITLKFLKVLYKEKHKLGKNMNNLKRIMIEYITENNEENIISYKKLINNSEIEIPQDDSKMGNGEIELNYGIILKIEIFLIKLEKLYYKNQSEKEVDRLRHFIKGVVEKLNAFVSKIDKGAYPFLLKHKIYMIAKLLNLCHEKIHSSLQELEENNINNIDEIKAKLNNHLLESSLKIIEIKDNHNKLDISSLIFNNHFFEILKYTVENYDKKFTFFNDFIDSTFDSVLNFNTLKEANEKRIKKIRDYLQIFWVFNIFTKGKSNEEVSDILLAKIINSKNIGLIKNILKLIIDNLIEESRIFSENLKGYIFKILEFIKKTKIKDLSCLKEIIEYIISTLFKYILSRVPKDPIYNIQKYIAEEIDKNMLEALKIVENQCSQLLINSRSIKNEIYQNNKLIYSENDKKVFYFLNNY